MNTMNMIFFPEIHFPLILHDSESDPNTTTAREFGLTTTTITIQNPNRNSGEES